MFLFDKCIFMGLEPITHRFQRFCGLDNFWLAKCAAVLFVVCMFDTYTNVAPAPGRHALLSVEEQKVFFLFIKIVYIPAAFMVAIFAIVMTNLISDSVYRDQVKGLSNKWKLEFEFVSLRFFLWAGVIFITIQASGDMIMHPTWLMEDLKQTPLAPIGCLSVFGWVYLVCCDPLPRSPSWLKKRLESFFSKKELVSEVRIKAVKPIRETCLSDGFSLLYLHSQIPAILNSCK